MRGATIDFHAHLAPPDPKAPPFLAHLFDVDGYLERQEAAGVDRTVLSYALAEIEGRPEELDEAKAQHEFLTDLLERYPDRFSALAGVDPFGGRPWLDEAERALASGFAGLCLPTSRLGRYLDSPECQDALALAAERGVVVFVHPSDSLFDVERAGDVTLRAWIGRPYDTGVCLSRMLLADTLGRYPGLRVVAAHCGGVLPMLLGRLDYVYESFERRARMAAGGGPPGGGPPGGGPPGGRGGPPGGGPPGPPVPDEARLVASISDRLPSGRIGSIYVDTASYHEAAITAAIAAFGVDHVVFGTDHPPAGESPEQSLAVLDRLGLSPEDHELISSATASRLLEPTTT